MDIGPKAKQKIYLFIEKEHGRVVRWLMLLVVSSLLVLLRTPRSLNKIVRRELRIGDFKSPIRRLNWLLRYSKVRKRLFSDDFFDFSLGLDYSASANMYSLLEGYSGPEIFENHVHLAQLASRMIESQLYPGESVSLENEELLSEYDHKYQNHLKQALELIELEKEHGPARTLDSKQKKDARSDAKSSLAFSQSTLAQDVFHATMDFMHEHQPSVYPISGTLLGIIRENRLLSHDVDIDIGVMEEDLKADVLINSIENSSIFYIKKIDYPVFRNCSAGEVSYSRMSLPSLIKFGHKRGLHIDLFVHFKDNGIRWHGSSLHRWDNSGFEIKQTTFMGREINVPANPELYLKENYGDWETPKIDFNCSIDTPNISLQNSCKTICYFVKLLHFYRAEPTVSRRILNLLQKQGISIPPHLA